MPGQRPIAPKPFFFLPLRGKPAREAPSGHERFQSMTGWLELEIEVISDYLYVGSGQFELRSVQGQEQAVYAFTRRNGQLIIPGTSIKGAVRSIVEAISNSCVRVKSRRERVRGSHNPRRCQNTLCPACRLFGSTGYRGRVHFTDAEPVGDIQPEIIKIAELWPPRRADGRKFYHNRQFQPLDLRPAKNHRFLEVVSKKARFHTRLIFENVENEEMGLIVRALGFDLHPEDPQKVIYAFPVKLGGAKPRCLGSVRFVPKRLFCLDEGPQILSSLLEGGRPEKVKPLLLRALNTTNLLDEEAWRRFLAEIRLVKESCPQGVY